MLPLNTKEREYEMKKFILLVIALFGSGVARAEVPPCNLHGDSWQVWRQVGQNEVEYKEVAIPFEVEILKGSGRVTCILNPQEGVSLVVARGFNPEVEHYGLNSDPGRLSWVKVGNASYPILSKYSLTVVPAPETKAYYLPQEQTQIIPQPQTRYYVPEKEEQVIESSCGWVCGGLIATAIWGVIYLLTNKNKSNPPPPPPPAVTTGGAY